MMNETTLRCLHAVVAARVDAGSLMAELVVALNSSLETLHDDRLGLRENYGDEEAARIGVALDIEDAVAQEW